MRYPILFFPLLLAGVGCVSHEQLVNFNQGPEFPAAGQAIAPVPEPLIQPFDALALSINALDAEAVAPFNLPATNPTGALAPTGSGPAQAGANYQVDAQGNIELPLVGTFHIGGLTVAQARDSIAAVLTRYVKTRSSPCADSRSSALRYSGKSKPLPPLPSRKTASPSCKPSVW
ncbi:MAG: polysaccharide biosynthesis/export family protein [Haliscomenobacter sp.]|nr:polysaccharide biosynthesis/export family protein [Haliscomenobacter sp.]